MMGRWLGDFVTFEPSMLHFLAFNRVMKPYLDIHESQEPLSKTGVNVK
jgi:hypothetical protein